MRPTTRANILARPALALALAGVIVAGCGRTGDTRGSTSSPRASSSSSASVPPSATTAQTMTVTVYFGNSGRGSDVDCALVFPIQRTVPVETDVLTAAVRTLLAGPSATERDQGYESFFTTASAGTLVAAHRQGATAYLDLRDHPRLIPNASTACGSAAYRAALTQTAATASGATRVLFALEGDPRAFWEWQQMGCSAANDTCDPAPFAS